MSKYGLKTRIEMIDALRGFALMGLFMVHMVEYFELHWYSPKPSAVFDAVMWMFGGKAYAMFAMLFGLSFFIIMDGQAKRGVDFRTRFSWRLVLLFLLGYVHSLIYSGDILQVLALIGLLLVFVYPLSNKFILTMALFFLLQVPAIVYLLYLMITPEIANSNPAHWGMMNEVFNAFANGSFAEVLHVNIYQSHMGKWTFFIESGRLWNIVGLFLIGLWLGRINFFSRAHRHTTLNAVAVISALFVAALMYYARAYVIQHPLETSLSHWVLRGVFTNYVNIALMLAGALFFVFCYQIKAFARVLNLLSPCGRMTLTLYVGQGLICVPLFFNYGLGWYETIDHSTSLGLGAIFWIVQVIFAHQWFKYYQYGPLEWLWRAATFTRMDIPFKSALRT